MPHVQGVTSDEDEYEDDDWDLDANERPQIPWIPIAAAGGAVLLVGVLIFVLIGRGGGGKSTPATTAPTATTIKLEALAATDPRAVAAQAALDAWAKFETTGKIADVGNTVAPDGPQYKSLKERASKIKPSAQPVTAVLTNPRVVPATPEQLAVGEQIVRADVVWKAATGTEKTVTWDLLLRSRPSPAGLWLWSAKTAAGDGGVATAQPGDFCGAARVSEGVPTNKDAQERVASAKDEASKVAAVVDIAGQRAAADKQLAASAPADIKSKVEAVAAGDAAYYDALKSAKTLKDISAANKRIDDNSAYKAGNAAWPAVSDYVKSKCGVNISPTR